MITKGLTDVQSFDSDIRVELKYHPTDNYFPADVCEDLEYCYLQKEFAE